MDKPTPLNNRPGHEHPHPNQRGELKEEKKKISFPQDGAAARRRCESLTGSMANL